MFESSSRSRFSWEKHHNAHHSYTTPQASARNYWTANAGTSMCPYMFSKGEGGTTQISGGRGELEGLPPTLPTNISAGGGAEPLPQQILSILLLGAGCYLQNAHINPGKYLLVSDLCVWFLMHDNSAKPIRSDGKKILLLFPTKLEKSLSRILKGYQ